MKRILTFSVRLFSGIAVLLCGFVLPVQTVVAQSKVGTTAAPFLTIGTGSRGSALGHAYTATATGGDALFWNPAGAAIKPEGTGQLFFTHHDLFAGIDYNAVGLIIPVDAYSVLGLSIASVNYGRMDITTEALPDGNGITFSASDLVVGLTYAAPLTKNFYFGFTGKYIRQNIWDMVAQTAAIDMGFVLQTDFLNGVKLAGSITNFGGKMQMQGVNTRIFYQIDENIRESNQQIPANIETGDWNLPISVKFGLSVPVIKKSGMEWNLLADAHQTNDNYTNADFGSELIFKTKTAGVSLRGGYRDLGLDNVDNHMSFGAGLDLNIVQYKISLDASLVPFNDLGLIRLIDMRIGF